MDCDHGRQVCSWRFPTWVGQVTCARAGELPYPLANLSPEASAMADRAPEVPHSLVRLFQSLEGANTVDCPSNRGYCLPVDPRPWYQDDLRCGAMLQGRIWPERKTGEFDELPDPMGTLDHCPPLPRRNLCRDSGRRKYVCGVTSWADGTAWRRIQERRW